MKRFLTGALASLFMLLLLFGGIAVHTTIQSQSNGSLINYVGIVRGATQRLVKLELSGREEDALIDYLDGILLDLTTGEGAYGLPRPNDDTYRTNLAELDRMWGELKACIAEYRADERNGSRLLELSEDYFSKANDTVFAAEAYSTQQVQVLLKVCIVMLAITLLACLLILLSLARNLLKLENSNRKLSDLTQRDKLTGVYQLDAFKGKAQQLLNELPQEKFAVLYTDFADFKYINDVFGYAYGDNILAQYGAILNAHLRENELAGRVSADNFVLLLRYQDKEEVAQRQQAVDNEISRFMQECQDGQSLPTYCGICCLEEVMEELRIDGFLDRANFARKTVKSGMRQNYVYYDESIRSRLWAEKDVERRMLSALERGEFKVHYQPKIELATGKIGCSEALVRWQSMDGIITPPDEFIPVFERKRMIGLLDRYVFEAVCQWLRHILDEGKRVLPVSINVSRLQFYDQNFVSRYVEIRDKYQIPPELLEIEFTESIAFDNTALLVRTVNRLKRAGFTCTIDDFGKGYSSLSLLKDLPIDILKIDSFFFADDGDQARNMALVEGVVELVKKFHVRTVAEGVEYPEQVEYLRKIGCDYIQGYVFYRPMPQAEYEALLDQGK